MRYMALWVVSLLAAAVCAQTPYGHPDFLPTPERPMGFRGDWGGHYPGATPPREWSPTYNVVWKRPVGVGESSPIVVGDRVFIVTDGIRLQCLRAATGEVLWEKTGHARADVPEEATASRWEEAVRLRHRIRRAEDRVKRAERALATLKADADRRKQPVEAKAAAALAAVVADSGADATAARDAQAKLLAAPDLAPDARILSAMSYAIATPCSDGKALYVYLPTGGVVSYDLDGNHLWYRTLGTRRTSGGWGSAEVAPSPLLAGGVLLVHYDKAYGLDPATGKVLWQSAVVGREIPIPSPIPLKVGGIWYAMMGVGRVLRMADGKCVFDPAWATNTTVHSPAAYGDIFCWVGCAVRMPAAENGEAMVAWELSGDALLTSRCIDANRTGPKHMLGWHGYACPLYLDGKVYFQAEKRAFSVFDARTGALLFSTDTGIGGEVYPALTQAGDIIISSNNKGASSVVTPAIGADFRVLAMNTIGALGGNMFVPVGNRMLVHAEEVSRDGLASEGMLYCLGDPLAEAPPTFRPADARVKREAPATGAALLALLDDPDDLAVFAALRTLKAPDDVETVVPDLAKRATSGDVRSASMALLALRTLGPKAKGAVPALVPLLDPGYGKTHSDVDLPARDALRAIGPESAAAMLAVAQKGRAPQERLMLPLLDLISGFGPAAAATAPTLEALAGGTTRTALAAKAALAKVTVKE